MGSDERKQFFPPDPSLSPKERDQLFKHLDAVFTLTDNCFRHFIDVRKNLRNELGRDPSGRETVYSLDEGHLAWLVKWLEIDENPQRVEDINLKYQEWDDWYEEWQPWFEEYHPEYFQEKSS